MNMTEGNLQLEAVYDSAKEQEAPVQEEQFFSNRKKDDYKKSNAVTITTEEVQTDKKLMVQTKMLKTSTAQTPQNGQTTPNLMHYIAQLTVQKPSHCHLCSSKFNDQKTTTNVANISNLLYPQYDPGIQGSHLRLRDDAI